MGKDLTIADLARLIADAVGFTSRLTFDHGYPDGTPRKLLDISRLSRLGWQAKTPLKEGLTATYKWFRESPRAQK